MVDYFAEAVANACREFNVPKRPPHDAEARLMYAIRDAEGAAADFAVLTSDARTAAELRMLASEANRLALIFGSACAAALRKIETL